MSFRLAVSASLVLACLAFAGCEVVPEVTDAEDHRADGTYKGDYQIVISYYEDTPLGGTTNQRSLTGAVGFTIQGEKIITTPLVGDGTAYWISGSRSVLLTFLSIVTNNDTFCAQWRYYGEIKEADNFLKGEGTLDCLAPKANFHGVISSYWKVTRQ